jgi:hypothetical protein
MANIHTAKTPVHASLALPKFFEATILVQTGNHPKYPAKIPRNTKMAKAAKIPKNTGSPSAIISSLPGETAYTDNYIEDPITWL